MCGIDRPGAKICTAAQPDVQLMREMKLLVFPLQYGSAGQPPQEAPVMIVEIRNLFLFCPLQHGSSRLPPQEAPFTIVEKRKLFQSFFKTLLCPLQYGALGPSEEPERLGRVVCCQQAPPQIGQPCYCRYAHTPDSCPQPPPALLLPLFSALWHDSTISKMVIKFVE